MMILNFDPTDCFTAEEEAAQDAREAERQEDEWLQSWADDFHSPEWAEVVPDDLHLMVLAWNSGSATQRAVALELADRNEQFNRRKPA